MLTTERGADSPPGVGPVLGMGAQEGVRGFPQSLVLPPALAPSSPAHSCPSCVPCATAQTCTSPGWQLGGGTPSHSAGGCPWGRWREEGDPHVKELKTPGPQVRALDRAPGGSAGNMDSLGRRPRCAHPSNGERPSCGDGLGGQGGGAPLTLMNCMSSFVFFSMCCSRSPWNVCTCVQCRVGVIRVALIIPRPRHPLHCPVQYSPPHS